MTIEWGRLFKQWGLKVGLIVGLLTAGLSLLFNAMKLPVINLTMSAVDINVRDRLIQGIPTNLGSKVLGYLSGIVPFTLSALFTVIISSILAVFFGAVVYQFKGDFFRAKTPASKLVQILLIGTALSTIVASWSLNIPPFATMAAMSLYFVLVSLLVWIGSTKLQWLRIPE